MSGERAPAGDPSEREEKRERILKAAMKVFAEHGFERAPVELIARKAGVSKGLIFWYYRSKTKLVEEVAIRSLPIDVIRICLDDSALSGRELLRRVALGYMKKYEDPIMRKLFLHTLSLAMTNENLAAKLNELCEMALRELARRTLGRDDHEGRVRMRAFFGGLLCYAIRRPRDIPPEEYVEHLVDIVCKGKPENWSPPPRS